MQVKKKFPNKKKKNLFFFATVYLFVDVVEVHSVEVLQHLFDLVAVVEHGPGRLGQVVEGRVAPQHLAQRRHSNHLQGGNNK